MWYIYSEMRNMLHLFKRKIDTIELPYRVKFNENSSITLEACGEYSGGFYCFHAVLKCKDPKKAHKVYVLLNENILREIIVHIPHNYVEAFKFDFVDIVSEEDFKGFVLREKKLLKEGTI